MPDFCSGVIPPVTTPFDDDGGLSLSCFEANLEHYLNFPLAGFLVLGSTGEAIHLNRRERLELVRAAAAATPSDRLLLVGVAEPTVVGALEFCEELNQLAVGGLLISTPHYYRNHTSAAGLLKFFTAVADRAPFPVLLYNFPQCSGVELAPAIVGELSAHPNIVGIKDSSGNLIYLQKILRETADRDFQVMGGSAEVIQPSWQLGVRAGIYAVACVIPELALELVEACQGAAPDSVRLQPLLFEVSSTIVGGLGVPGIKYAMDCRGWRGGAPRLPLLPLEPQQRRRVDSVLDRALVVR